VARTEKALEIDPATLDAVARILERDGLRGLTVSAVAAEAGVSRVTMHRRGIGVEDCVVAVLRRASVELQESLWPALTGPGTAAQRLMDALAVLCDLFERHSGVMRAVYGVPARPIPSSPGRTTSQEFIEPFARLLRDGQADGSLDVADPDRQATLLANTVAWTYLHMRTAHKWPHGELRRQVIAIATAHLRPARPGSV
jgi:AcrR family transcriptional regulator